VAGGREVRARMAGDQAVEGAVGVMVAVEVAVTREVREVRAVMPVARVARVAVESVATGVA
jgi:hypothetical protein